MRQRTTTAILGLALLSTIGCQTTSRESRSIHRVDDLLTTIERVHFLSEQGQRGVREALGALHEIVAPKFGGDPATDYGAFVLALEACEAQAEELEESIDPMREAAEALFDQWTADLVAFSNPDMRARSRERLENTRRRYQAIVAAVQPTQAEFASMNRSLRDCALFLGHDFNSGAVQTLAPTVRDLTKVAKELDDRFETCMQAAAEYITTAGLRGQVEEPSIEPTATTDS